MRFGEMEPRENSNYDWSRRMNTYDIPHTPENAKLEPEALSSLNSSTSNPTTVIRFHNARILQNQVFYSSSTQRSPDLYLPPFQGPINNADSLPNSVQSNEYEKFTTNVNASTYFPPTEKTSNKPLQMEMIQNSDSLSTSLRDKAHNYDPNLPSPVDSTPYILYAIDQLSRAEGARSPAILPNASCCDSYPVERILPNYGLGYTTSGPCHEIAPVEWSPKSDATKLPGPEFALHYMSPEREREGLALTRKYRSSPDPSRLYSVITSEPQTSSPGIPTSPISNCSDIFIPTGQPKNSSRFPDLTFVPRILRPISMIILSFFCLCIIISLVVLAVCFRDNGIREWSGESSYRGDFIFRFLPQIIAGIAFIYVQSIMSAITRIMPFVLLANPEVQGHSNALFARIYPLTTLPTRSGNVPTDIFMFFYWLSVFTIPLQSSLFSPALLNGSWRWLTVQGIAWALVALYVLILIAAIGTGCFFHKLTTGLVWDPRSLADIIALLPRSNSLNKFAGTDILASKEEIRRKLGWRCDRLGYWRTPNPYQEVFYCFGQEGVAEAQNTSMYSLFHDRILNFNSQRLVDAEKAVRRHDPRIRFRYIPWYLRDYSVGLWFALGFAFLLALSIAAFLPRVAIWHSFCPLVSVGTDSAGFSNAYFLYSFVPSLVGMVLYLLYQPLDMGLRVLKPWIELSNVDGTTADESLLLDYPASYPIQVTLSAISAGHYLIATTSFLSTIFILLPILAGGLFSPFVSSISEGDRLILNMSAFIPLLLLLTLYIVGLLLLLPRLHRMYLPHGISCLAEVIAFFHNSHVIDDAAFSSARSKTELTTRLLAEKSRGGMHRWAFGIYKGRNGKDSLGIERVGRNPGVGLMILSR